MHRNTQGEHVSSESNRRFQKDVPPEERELHEELRRFRETSGLSLQALAHDTGYSKPSWHRVFRQGAFPPREAVARLCARRKLDSSHLLTLWDRAHQARVQRALAPLEPAEKEALPSADHHGEEEYSLVEAGQDAADPTPRRGDAGATSAGEDAAIAEPPPQHGAPTSGPVSPVEQISAEHASHTASRYGGGRFLVLLTASLILLSVCGLYLLREALDSHPGTGLTAPQHAQSPRSSPPSSKPPETPTSPASHTTRKRPPGTSSQQPSEPPVGTRPPADPTKGALTTADPGAQLGCSGGESVSNTDTGHGRLTHAGNMKSGPYTACSNVRAVTPGTEVYYWCSVTNRYGHSWTYARIKEQAWQGWLSGDNVDDGGSTKPC
jgi:hypothetical protein